MSDVLTIQGILTAKTIAFAGFAILGVFLLVIVVWGILQATRGGDLWTLATTVFGGAIILFLGYLLIYNLANTYFVIDTNTTLEQATTEQSMIQQSIYSPDRITTPTKSLPMQITNIQVCADNNMPCQTTGLTSTDVNIYWEVENGIGCCNTFGCNYQTFIAFCGSPFTEFKLYDIALDGETFQWGPAVTDYDYHCSYDTPWNNFVYTDVGIGRHYITIWQKDCQDIIDVATIPFEIIDDGGTYEIRRY